MQPGRVSATARAARTAAAASTPSHLAQASTASPTSSTPAPSRSRPSDAASKSSQSTQKRPRPRPPKSRLQGSWLPVLTSRSGTGRGCGHYVFGQPSPTSKIAAFGAFHEQSRRETLRSCIAAWATQCFETWVSTPSLLIGDPRLARRSRRHSHTAAERPVLPARLGRLGVLRPQRRFQVARDPQRRVCTPCS